MTSGPENPDSEQEPDSGQDENYLLGVRRQKLQNLRDRGIDPYPHSYDRSHTTAEALALFDAAEAESGEDALGLRLKLRAAMGFVNLVRVRLGRFVL